MKRVLYSLIANYFVARDGKQHIRILSYRILQWGLSIGVLVGLLVALSSRVLPRLFSSDSQVLWMSPSK